MGNKTWYIVMSILCSILLGCFIIILTDLSKIMIISNIILTIAESFLLLIAAASFAISSLYRQKWEDATHELETEKSFNYTYIDSLYRENEVLKETINIISKENELLKLFVVNPSGHKMN